MVDDEEGVLSAMRRRLERAQCTVDTASSATEAMGLINNAVPPYDVIVTDMSMEEPESGVQVLNEAFRRDLFAQVIVMTAYGSVENAVLAMRKGAFDYLEKNSPTLDAYDMVVIKVNQALGRKRRDIKTIALWQRAIAGRRAES